MEAGDRRSPTLLSLDNLGVGGVMHRGWKAGLGPAKTSTSNASPIPTSAPVSNLVRVEDGRTIHPPSRSAGPLGGPERPNRWGQRLQASAAGARKDPRSVLLF